MKLADTTRTRVTEGIGPDGPPIERLKMERKMFYYVIRGEDGQAVAVSEPYLFWSDAKMASVIAGRMEYETVSIVSLNAYLAASLRASVGS